MQPSIVGYVLSLVQNSPSQILNLCWGEKGKSYSPVHNSRDTEERERETDRNWEYWFGLDPSRSVSTSRRRWRFSVGRHCCSCCFNFKLLCFLTLHQLLPRSIIPAPTTTAMRISCRYYFLRSRIWVPNTNLSTTSITILLILLLWLGCFEGNSGEAGVGFGRNENIEIGCWECEVWTCGELWNSSGIRENSAVGKIFWSGVFLEKAELC